MNNYILNATSTRIALSTNRANSKGKVIQLPANYDNPYVLIWNNGSEIKVFCQSTHEELMVSQLVKFSEVESGADILIDGLKYRKSRPWAPQQFNASLMDDSIDYEAHAPFIRVKDDKLVELLSN